MAQVVRDKEKDEILRYIYQEYDKWIRSVKQSLMQNVYIS